MSGRPRVLSPFRSILGSAWGEWREQAACRDLSKDEQANFFPDGWGAERLAQAARAKLVCAGCPVREECLDAHLPEPEGIFGGHDADERRVIMRRRGIRPAR